MIVYGNLWMMGWLTQDSNCDSFRNLFQKVLWTGKELNGLFAKQEDGKKVILPVWHNISKDKVKEYSPILADMLALENLRLHNRRACRGIH